MACTSQCAREYVWSARLHLVRHLRNISVIVDNLYQEEVLHNEEVDELETEKNDNTKKRKLMDLVIKKGEEACYKFLRIIDMTWKRASGRGSTLSETTEASSEFNLSFWISCFPFKEDAENYKGCLQGPRSCHEYQSKLKTKALKKSSEFWMTNKKLFDENYNPDLCYNPLVLDTQEREPPSKTKKFKSKKGKMSRPKKLKTYIPEGKPSMSLNDLVKIEKNILLVGKPGIGKTALCHEMLKLWAESENKELDYMFYFDMRETSHFTGRMSLEELLFSVYSEPDEGKEEVLEDIKKNSDHVTLIFDGITDLSSSLVKRIIEKDLLPDAKVILTCRPDNEDDFLSGDFVRVEVKGFSEQTIKNYFSVFLGENHKKVLCHLELFTLCHVPMYALMVAACFLSKTSEALPQPCSMTEIYINIVRYCLEMSRENKSSSLNRFIKEEKDKILSLAELAFHATKRKTVILTDLPYEDSCVLCFLKPLSEKVAPTETRKTYAFLHYTVQEFFAALWLLKNPDQIKDVFQQCLTEEGKHMKHLIPFMCRLLTEKSPSLLEHLIPAQKLKSTSSWIFKDMINTFYCECTEDGEPDADLLFVCQCLYESQCPAACVCFLETLDYHLDLSGESLDSYLCCAVANVVTLSKERKVRLNLEDVSVSEQGMTSLFGCLDNVLWCDPLPQQLWRIFFEGAQLNDPQLVSCDGNHFCLPLQGNGELCNGAADFLQKNQMKVDVCLHWDSREITACPRLSGSLFKALPCITSLRFYDWSVNGVKLCGSLFCAAAERDQQTGEKTLELLASLCSHQIYPISFSNVIRLSPEVDTCDFLLDLCSYIKGHETKTGLSVLPSLKSVFKSAPSVWTIDLSERKTSILLEVLRLQPEKKSVKLRGCSCEESEVRTFLQCLPYISQLSFYDWSENGVKFCGSLFCAAAERDQRTGEKTLELLASLCSYKTFPFPSYYMYNTYGVYECYFLLGLCSYIKDYETKTGSSVLPSLKPVFKSAPSVWIIDLSKRKTSILLEVLRLQPEKKSVELRSCSCEESEVMTFLQCLPYISQLSFIDRSENGVKLCGRLFCAAAERDQQTGEKTLELLASLCSYQTFPFQSYEEYDDFEVERCDFLLDLCSYIKKYETEKSLSVLPSLKPVFKSTPSVWSIDLSKRKTSILLEVLKLQPEKKSVELRGCSCEESEVRTFLQCLPYISQLSCGPEFFQRVCKCLSVRSRQEAEQLVSLLQLLGFSLTLPEELPSKLCKSIGRVLGLCGSKVDLVLKPTKTSVRGASLLFRHTRSLRSLRLSDGVALLLCGWVRRGRVNRLSVTGELSLSSQKQQPSERKMLRVVSSLASLLRYWKVRQLDLTESRIPAQSLIPFLLHEGPLTIRLSGEVSESLLAVLHETQDKDLTRSYLSKVGGDLTPVCLNWELLHHLLESSPQTVTVNLRKNSFLLESFTRLLAFLDRVLFKRLSPSFVLNAIKEIYRTRASPVIPALLKSFDHELNLTCREMDSEDCEALLYTLRHSNWVKLNLMWTSVPTEEINSILLVLEKVSQLSVDRDLLLRIVHCCAASAAPQDRAVSLLRSLQHRLDLSCSSHVNLSAEGQSETLCLSFSDCRAIVTVLRFSSQDTELQLQDCEVEDSGLDLLFPVLDRVQLKASKVVLLQMVSLVRLAPEWDSVSRVRSLCGALGGELVLSHTKLDQMACEALALVLDYAEELTELDLSYCQLTNQLLVTLMENLHKVQVLDLSHNKITDESTSTLLGLVNINPNIETVRLFGNDIVDQTPFKALEQFEIW
ncbi:uncharacterized protein LOC141798726 [Halichoeres trimaculatus]|uniref:uncharacterized protein LOC141798726 n=1 Tax=Halichoeres trimaculatus TaxID=147232 RepID=UPI003D9F286C